MKVYFTIIAAVAVIVISGCCDTHNGYGRYTLKVDCDKVMIDGDEYIITKHNDDFAVGGHTIVRGINRKTKPWLYVHEIRDNVVDITFEEGEKKEYPLYTGSGESIFDLYSKS